MATSDTSDREMLRSYLVLAGMAAAFLFLVVSLWGIQVAHGSEYEQDLRRQSIRRVRLPGGRGRILDRNGVCLADNRSSYCIAIYLEELRQLGQIGRRNVTNVVYDVVCDLSDALGLPVVVTKGQISDHIRKRSPLPFLAWRDVGKKAVAILKEGTRRFPGVDIYVEPVRVYPQGEVAAHIIGYVGRAQSVPAENEVSYHYYLPEMEGRRGIEKTQDSLLRGRAGGLLLRVDASGYKYDLPGHREVMLDPVSGADIRLTLDVGIQRLAERVLGDRIGAMVVLDPRNGDILAMVSRPTFDPGWFANGISQADWSRLSEDENAPLLNRAVSASYPPGSIFKLVDVIAALEQGSGITGSTAFQCPGYYSLGGKAQLRCWNWQHGGHGLLAMRESLEQSCNTYFCSLVAKCGYREVYKTAVTLGLGSKPGCGIDAERAGQIPAVRSLVSKGDVANVSIGQGALQVTPLQMAVVTATIANGGHHYRARLVDAVSRPDDRAFRAMPLSRPKEMNWSRETLDVVRGGMYDVVHARRGTGRRANADGFDVAGKTGSAEYGRKEDRKKRGWMVAFAPYSNPRYAVAMVTDEAVSGGITVAPMIKELIEGIAQIENGMTAGTGR